MNGVSKSHKDEMKELQDELLKNYTVNQFYHQGAFDALLGLLNWIDNHFDFIKFEKGNTYYFYKPLIMLFLKDLDMFLMEQDQYPVRAKKSNNKKDPYWIIMPDMADMIDLHRSLKRAGVQVDTVFWEDYIKVLSNFSAADLIGK